MLFRLEAAGVEHVWLESRNVLLDRRDRVAVDGFRARKVITAKIRVNHARPGDQPLLWVSDIVAGAVSAAEADEPHYRSQLESILVEHRVQLN